ncbi:MAG: 4-hydroxyphenylacetate decarboxylase small subunit [Bacteroidales bacterium]|nr:4-hydroxyphenylacetate decarboxylase small subunit [Bacteroidales bacterium]
MKHYDCKYYLDIDAFRGICKRDKSQINADDSACEHFEKATKCKHCANFSMTETDLGMCMNEYDAYPEMKAITCNDFKWK